MTETEQSFSDDHEGEATVFPDGSLDKSHVDAVVGFGVSLGKTRATQNINSSRAAPGGDRKTETLSYLDQLRDAASIAFQQFREGTPGQASDGELLLFFDAMNIVNHLISQYKQAITEKLKRFEQSQVSQIGRQKTVRRSYLENGKPSIGHQPMVVRDVWVQWHSYLSGSPTELVYVFEDGEWDPRDNEKNTRQPIDPRNPSKGLQPRERKHVRRAVSKPAIGVSTDPNSIAFVPREFVAVALERHRAHWKSAPIEVLIDDSTYYWDPIRAEKAKKNKTANSHSHAVPLPAAPKKDNGKVIAALSAVNSTDQSEDIA